jgi:hypothetical protein
LFFVTGKASAIYCSGSGGYGTLRCCCDDGKYGGCFSSSYHPVQTVDDYGCQGCPSGWGSSDWGSNGSEDDCYRMSTTSYTSGCTVTQGTEKAYYPNINGAWVGATTVTCIGGCIKNGNTCTCPPGYSLVGSECVEDAKQCPTGTVCSTGADGTGSYEMRTTGSGTYLGNSACG